MKTINYKDLGMPLIKQHLEAIQLKYLLDFQMSSTSTRAIFSKVIKEENAIALSRIIGVDKVRDYTISTLFLRLGGGVDLNQPFQTVVLDQEQQIIKSVNYGTRTAAEVGHAEVVLEVRGLQVPSV